MPQSGQHLCPHCQAIMKKYAVSPFNFSDGLGWGVPILMVCFNDECPLFVGAWETTMQYYGKIGSQRYWLDPESGKGGALPVGSRNAMRGDIIEE